MIYFLAGHFFHARGAPPPRVRSRLSPLADASRALRASRLRPLAWPRALLRERVGTNLEVHGFAGRALAAFDMPRRAIRPAGPQALPLPTGFRIVDPAVDRLVVEPERVRHAQHDELPPDQSEQRT